MHAVAGHPPHRPAAHPPRPAATGHVRRAGRPAGRGHAGPPPARGRVRHAGRRQVAPGRGPGEPAPARRVRRLLRLPLRQRHVHGVAGPALLPRDRLLRGPHRVDREPPLQPVLRPRHPRRRAGGRRGGDDPGPLPPRRPLGDLLHRLHPAHGRRGPALVPLPRHPRRALRQLPAGAVPRRVAGQAPLPRHDPRARRHRRSPDGHAGGDRAARGHPRVPLVGQRAAHGDVAGLPATRRSAARRARPGRAACGCRRSSRGRG